ncbi:MAG: TIGR00300 family protein [Planctomycetota bacterium]|nr:TIGR00300 family protein [Planctomycetota bacterium]
MSATFEKNLFAAAGKDFRSLMTAAFQAAGQHPGDVEVRRLTDEDLQILVTATDVADGNALVDALIALGFEERGNSGEHSEDPVKWQPASAAGVAPEGFYSTTHHHTEVFDGADWQVIPQQRMDGCITRREGLLACTKLRDVQVGDEVAIGMDGVRIRAEVADESRPAFAFMSNDVSSERRAEVQIRAVVELARAARENGKKIVWVPGPVVVHTGAANDLAQLVAAGWVDAVLSGNALAVHDIESQLHGTSLGVSVTDGSVVEHGHSHHMRAINRIREQGSIEAAVASGVLEGGLMHALVQHQIPFVLAGSIRDDGPLPETMMDLIDAQDRYASQLQDAGLVIILASMLHGIGVGNMLPGSVPLVCVDIHPAVATKLADRGSAQALGIVTDVGLFVRTLREQLIG